VWRLYICHDASERWRDALNSSTAREQNFFNNQLDKVGRDSAGTFRGQVMLAVSGYAELIRCFEAAYTLGPQSVFFTAASWKALVSFDAFLFKKPSSVVFTVASWKVERFEVHGA